MQLHSSAPLDPVLFLHNAGVGRRVIQSRSKQVLFTQGEQSDSVFFLQEGRVRLSVTSHQGREATIALMNSNAFLGEEAIVGLGAMRSSTATAITPCTALRIDRAEMIRVMHEEHSFSNLFVSFLLRRAMRMQEDLIDHLFNSSEKRLARVLLLLAQFGESAGSEMIVPKISQETLAEMVGTTRSRVSFFMNRFRKLGLIEYSDRIKVNKSLLNVMLNDQ